MTTYVITYRMLVGTGTREVLAAEDVVAEYRELQEAGAGYITIRDRTGRVVELAELVAVAPFSQGSAHGSEPNA